MSGVAPLTSDTAVDHMLKLSVTGTTSLILNSKHAKTKIPAMLMSTNARDMRASCRYYEFNHHTIYIFIAWLDEIVASL